jgi:hypothetical protein
MLHFVENLIGMDIIMDMPKHDYEMIKDLIIQSPNWA